MENGQQQASQAAAGGGKAGGGLGAWWQSVTKSPGAENVRGRMTSVAQKVKENASKVKTWSMPVDVKVDFLQPTIQTVKGAAQAVWVQLPPQAQQAAPYVGVAFGSGLLVYIVQQRRVKYYVGVLVLWVPCM